MKKASISIETVIIICLTLLVLLVIIPVGVDIYKRSQFFNKGPALTKEDRANYLNIETTEPEVYIGAGWKCSDTELQEDKNGERWLNIEFDKNIEGSIEGTYEIYRDGWSLVDPGRYEEWIRYDIIMNDPTIDLGQGDYGGGIVDLSEEFPKITATLVDGKTIKMGPFPEKGVIGDYYFLIKFKTEKNGEQFLSSAGNGLPINPDRYAVKFRVP